MSLPVHINSSAQWRQLLSSHNVVIADFYADWCGPCKMIAPHFSGLATKHSKPSRIAFAKINVDSHKDIASTYGVRAMPTFLVFRNGSVIETIQGANPPALSAAVEKAVKLSGGATASGPGQRLGGVPLRSGGGGVARPIRWDLNGLVKAIITFFGLYFTSLFSLDPYKAAENSQFNRKNTPKRTPAAGARPGARPVTFKTLADLGSD